MKILYALLALGFLASGPVSHAGVSAATDLPVTESKSVQAVRALLTRCMAPVLSGKPAIVTGLFPAETSLSRHLLGARSGDVWTVRDHSVMVIDYHDTPHCRVMAFGVDPAVLGDVILGVFREADTGFSQRRFRIDHGGNFAAVYTTDHTGGEVVVRISTALAENGVQFATLSVARPTVIGN